MMLVLLRFSLLCGRLVFVSWCRKVMATAASIWGVLHMWPQPEDNSYNDNAHGASTRCPQLNKWLTSTFTWDVEISDDRLKCTMVPPTSVVFTHMPFKLTRICWSALLSPVLTYVYVCLFTQRNIVHMSQAE